MICFTRLPLFSSYNVEKIEEPGDEAIEKYGVARGSCVAIEKYGVACVAIRKYGVACVAPV